MEPPPGAENGSTKPDFAEVPSYARWAPKAPLLPLLRGPTEVGQLPDLGNRDARCVGRRNEALEFRSSLSTQSLGAATLGGTQLSDHPEDSGPMGLRIVLSSTAIVAMTAPESVLVP